MSEPIKAGDLVRIVGAACSCGERELGMIFTVHAVSRERTACFNCNKASWTGMTAKLVNHEGLEAWKPLPWLKRIPPLEELGTTELSEVANDLRHKKVELDDSLERLQRIVEETSATHSENT